MPTEPNAEPPRGEKPPKTAVVPVATGAAWRLDHARRRQLFLETTLHVLAMSGAEGASLRSVCRELNVVPSQMARYFEGWHDQLLATHRMIAERCLAELATILSAPYGSEKVRAREFIHCCLSSRWIGKDMVGAMTALWEMARTIPELRAGFERFFEARHLLLVEALERLAAETGATLSLSDTAASLLLLVDGIWMHHAANPAAYIEHDALEVCWSWLTERLGKAELRNDAELGDITRGDG